MTIGLVIPAFGRYEVTNLALTGLGWLTRVLAERGIVSRVAVAADDGNLELAGQHGLDTLKMPNQLGARVNAGFRYMVEHDCDWFCFTGSDNWLHPDLFHGLGRESVRAGLSLAIVDLERPRLRRIPCHGLNGSAPWLLPRSVLGPSGFAPCRPDAMRGIEQEIRTGLNCLPRWEYDEPHDLARVDFKTQANITPYQALAGSRDIEESPWKPLAEHYPEPLVALAKNTVESLAVAA